MILDPIQRRFGYGSARLRIARPDGVQALSIAARKPRAFESAFAALPSLFCAGIAFLLFVSIRLDAAPPPQTPLELHLWSEASLPAQASAGQPQVPEVDVVQAKSSTTGPESLATTDPAETPFVEESRPDFDLDSIAMSAPKPISPHIETALPNVRIARPNAGTSSRRPSKTNLALSAIPRPVNVDPHREDTPGIDNAIHPSARRPRSGARSDPADALDAWSGSGTRRQFLAAHAELESAGPQTARTARPPEVSAAGLASASASSQIVRENLKHSAYGVGWEEVPLEELPDCSPAGRQDLLKKRILLAAPFERECSHQDGSYRFVETRNLGAFLMWSRTKPDRLASQPRARNVCDVLERALRCLDASSIEESSAQ